MGKEEFIITADQRLNEKELDLDGSFSDELQIDDIVIADNAIISDGTSKEYSNDSEAKPTKK